MNIAIIVLVALVMMIALQDTLISFEEFVQIMDASDVEHKMSMKFVGQDGYPTMLKYKINIQDACEIMQSVLISTVDPL